MVASTAAHGVPEADLPPLADGPLASVPATGDAVGGVAVDAALAQVWRALEAVTDPEIPVVNLREMGILRRVRREGDTLVVDITPTYSGCPAMRQMALDIEEALAPGHGAVRVQTHLSPAWSTDWITPEAREKLRAWGIAPPAAKAAGACGMGAGAPAGTGAQTPTGLPDAALRGTQALQFALRASTPEVVPCPRCGSGQTMAVAQFGSTACKALYRCLACHEPFDYFKPY